MTLYAFDAAYPPSGSIGSALTAGLVYKANGGIAANVYVSGGHAQDANHVRGLRADGVAPWPNYEQTLWELVQDVDDRATGRRAGAQGIADAIRCGFPADGTIWFPFSIDVSLDPSRYGEAANAFRGIQDVNAGRFRISCYGQGGLISYLRAQGVIREKGWLSASSSFPGYDRDSSDVCVWQETGDHIPGHSTDRNVITDPHALGAWWPAGSPYIITGDDMSAAAEQMIKDIHDRLKKIDVMAYNVNGGTGAASMRSVLGSIGQKVGAPPALDVNALAAAIAAKLPTSTGATAAQVTEAVRAVFLDAATP